MTSDELPPALLALIRGPVGTIAHVEMLLALRAAEPAARTLAEVAAAAHVGRPRDAHDILRELGAAGLVAPRGADAWVYAPRGAAARDSVDRLASLYDERPMTLIRALQERPVRPLHSFVDAFRLRRRD